MRHELSLICLTQHSGSHIHPVTLEDGETLPREIFVMSSVPVHSVQEVMVEKFDPRKDWGRHIDGHSEVIKKVRCVHFFGSVYMEEAMPFMRKYRERTKALDTRTSRRIPA